MTVLVEGRLLRQKWQLKIAYGTLLSLIVVGSEAHRRLERNWPSLDSGIPRTIQ